jgi:zinc transport system substrate-binding protein
MRVAATLAALLASTTLAHAEVKVMASIKPIHSLVAQVMEGVGTPGLIVDGAGSPHTFSLKPDQAAALEQSQVIFWVGHELEAFLEKPIEALGSKAKAVSLMEAEGVKHLAVREGATFDAHADHGEEGHTEHAGHDHDHDKKAENAEGEHKHDHDDKKAEGEHKHEHGEEDAHIWLAPENAIALVNTIAATLSEADKDNAKTYAANAEKTIANIKALDEELKPLVAPAKDKGFIVFHDAYQYFESSYGLAAAGAISINPENPPGAAAITKLRERIAAGKVKCVFSEPQFDAKLVNIILEGSTVKAAVLDPLGADVEPGPELYGKVMRNLATNLGGCLGT